MESKLAYLFCALMWGISFYLFNSYTLKFDEKTEKERIKKVENLAWVLTVIGAIPLIIFGDF